MGVCVWFAIAKKSKLVSPFLFHGTLLGFLLLSPLQARGQVLSGRQEAGRAEGSFLSIQQQKEKFAASVKELVKALEGRFGDEGYRIWPAIEAIRRELQKWDEAIRALEATRASNPPSAESHVALGRAYLDRSLIEDALREFAAAIRLAPTRADAQTLAGLAHRRAGRLAEAVEAFRKAAGLDPEELTTSYSLAQILIKTGHQEEGRKSLEGFNQLQKKRLTAQSLTDAIRRSLDGGFKTVEEPTELLERAGILAPVFVPALYNSGFTLLKQGKYDQAVVALAKAAAADPLTANGSAKTNRPAEELEAIRRGIASNQRNAALYYRLGETYLALDRKEEARQAFEQAFKLDPSFSRARLGLGRLALRNGKLETALEHLIAVVQQEEGLVEGRRALGLAYLADGRHEKSIEQLKAAVRLSARDERLRMALAEAFVLAGKLGEAEQALKEAIQVIPDSGQAHYNLGRLYSRLGRWQEAAQKFRDAVEVRPLVGLGHLYRGLARIYFRQVKLDDAVEAYRNSLELNPNDPEGHRALGELLLQRNRYDEALAEFLAAVAVEPQSADAYVGMSQVYLRTGRYVEAAESSQKALALNEHHRGARYTLASALMRLGKTEEGQKELQTFQQMQAEALAAEHRQRELGALKQEAAKRLEKGEYDKAIGLLQKAVEYEPHVGIPYMSLGAGLIKAGRYEEAIQSLQKALQLQADFPDVHRHLAEAYRALGRLEESEKEKAIYTRMKQEQLRRIGESY